MLQNKKVIQVVISAVMALLFVNIYLRGKEDNLESRYAMVEVLIAARDIPPYTAINSSYLRMENVPQKFMQPGAIMVKEPDLAMKRVVNKVTIAAIPAGSQITLSNLKDPSDIGTGVAPMIPPGKRGFPLRLGNTDVTDLILPGNYVDVIATFAIKQGENSTKGTYTILQNILVVAVGRQVRPRDQDVAPSKSEAAEGMVLTLALDPTEAERLSLAQSESGGEISVVVRPHGDNQIRPLPGVTGSKLFG